MCTQPLPAPPAAKKTRGQSLVEVTLLMPILLMMLAGLVEFGFALNQYLNTLDAAREAARYSSDGDPLIRAACGDDDHDDLSDEIPGAIDDGCPGFAMVGALPDNAITTTSVITDENWLYQGTTDFYVQAASIALQTVSPVPLDPFSDDVIISVFRVLSGTIVARWPNCAPDVAFDCPNDPPTYTETLGEWHLYGYSAGTNCGDTIDNDGDGLIDEGCYAGGALVDQLVNATDPLEGLCDPVTEPLCHPSRLSSAQVQALLDPAAPNSAMVAVEIFFSYNQILGLPWITPFVPDPIPMHTFTVAPIPAAEPSLTISGTITETVANIPVSGVTIDFRLPDGTSAGQAITDSDGHYVRGGLQSGSYNLVPTKPGCNTFTPANFSNPVVVTILDAPNRNFNAVCPTPTPSPTPTSTPTLTNTPPPGSTPTETPTPTLTPTPTETPNCGPGQPLSDALSQFTVSSSSLRSDGSDAGTLLVTVKDICGQLVPGVSVSLSSSRGSGVGGDTISPASGTTDSNGQFVASVTSSTSSPYDDVTGLLTSSSTFTAQLNGGAVTLTDQPTATFVCVNGIKGGSNSNYDVQYIYRNDTAENRVLNRMILTWPAFTGRALTQLSMYPAYNIVWTGSATTNPIIINTWPSTDAERTIATGGVLRTLELLFNVDLTTIPGTNFTVVTEWRNPVNGTVCAADSITVTR